jgi:hypothetical protein
MFITPSIKYYGLRRGSQYRVLAEGRDYKILSVNGKPMYIPEYIFEQGYVDEQDEYEEQTEIAE